MAPKSLWGPPLPSELTLNGRSSPLSCLQLLLEDAMALQANESSATFGFLFSAEGFHSSRFFLTLTPWEIVFLGEKMVCFSSLWFGFLI